MKHLKKVLMTFAFALALIGVISISDSNDVKAATCRHRFATTYVSNGSAVNHTIKKVCTKCGAIDTSTTEGHAFTNPSSQYVNSSSHKTESVCAYCGYKRTVMETHDFYNTTYTSQGNNIHTKTSICRYCGYTKSTTETHSFRNSGYQPNGSTHYALRRCVYCGQMDRSVVENHQWNNAYAGNSTGHTNRRSCNKCGYTETINEPHTFGAYSNYNSSQHYRTCSKCGYREYAVHYGTTTYSQYNSTGHIKTINCRYCAGVVTKTESHNFVNGVCSLCGYRK